MLAPQKTKVGTKTESPEPEPQNHYPPKSRSGPWKERVPEISIEHHGSVLVAVLSTSVVNQK